MRLSDIYTQSELDDDESEIFPHVAEEDLVTEFTPVEIPADRVAALMATDIETVLETWEHAEDWQEELVEEKRRNFDAQRVILLRGDVVIDGHHHVMAAILEGRSVTAIDLEEFSLLPPGP